MAQDIEFIPGFKNRATYGNEEVVDLDMTPYFRGVSTGSKIDYNYFNSQSSNVNFTAPTIYTTFTSTETPNATMNVPDFFRYKVTRSELLAGYDPGTYRVFNVRVGDLGDEPYYYFCEFSFTGKNGNRPGSIDHFTVRYGLESLYGTWHQYFYEADEGFLNPGEYDPFFIAGMGFLRIEDPTVPEDRRYVFAVSAMLVRPSADYRWPYFPIPQGFLESTTATRTACFPYRTEEMTGNPTGDLDGYVKFIDIPKMIGVLNLRPNLEIMEDSPEVGPASEEEPFDNPSHDDSSDTIDIPAEPTIGVTNVGFVNVYRTGSNSLQNMGVELFPPLTYTPPTPISGTDVTDAIVNGMNQIVTFLGNIPSFFDQMVANTLINYIIDCHMIPVTPSYGSSEAIKVGYKTMLTATGNRVTSDYKDFDCGSISLAEYYSNFADFLESAKLYLPFVGFVSARPEWFKRTSLQVKYRFNIIDGSFVAYVLSSGRYVNNNNSGKTIVGQYAGNACVHIPITGVTYSNMVSGLIGAGSGAIAGAASGNIAAAATSAIAAAGVHGDIAQSNSYNASASFMGCRRPFLLIERPVSNYSASYQREIGLPSNISKKIGSLTGFAMMGDIHLDGIDATDQEKLEIEKLLRSGVIL